MPRCTLTEDPEGRQGAQIQYCLKKVQKSWLCWPTKFELKIFKLLFFIPSPYSHVITHFHLSRRGHKILWNSDFFLFGTSEFSSGLRVRAYTRRRWQMLTRNKTRLSTELTSFSYVSLFLPPPCSTVCLTVSFFLHGSLYLVLCSFLTWPYLYASLFSL